MTGNNTLSKHKLGDFLATVMNWDWETFVRAEADEEGYSSADAIVFALIRACALEDMAAIKLAINRFDGKLVTSVKIIYPKVFFLFPNATTVEGAPSTATSPHLLEQPAPTTTDLTIALSEEAPQDENENILPTLGLRQTLDRMVDYPRSVPQQLIDQSIDMHQWVRGTSKSPFKPRYNPAVKSVVAAHLLRLGTRRNMDALYEIFNAIDGKLTEVIQMVGEDIELVSYATIAPFGAEKNAEGVYQIEASETQNLWMQKLGEK